MNTLTKNPKVTSLLNIQDIDARKLRTIVFRIIYVIIYMNTQKIRPTNVKFMIDLYDYSKSSLYNAKNLNSLVCTQMGIDEEINTNMQETGAVLDALRTIGLVVKTENLYDKAECNYYITNPSVVNQLLKNIAEILETAVLKTRWLNDVGSDSFVSGRVVGRSIIYGGESGIFRGFADPSSIYPPLYRTVSQIEQQNMNTELISAEEYLLYTDEKLSILETYSCNDA